MGGKLSKEQHAELVLLYQDALDEIRFSKRQQWAVTNYGLLLYAAIVSADKMPGSGTCVTQNVLLTVLAATVFTVAVLSLVRYQTHMTGNRNRLNHIRDRFSPETFIPAWEAYPGKKHVKGAKAHWCKDWRTFVSLVSVLLGGASLSCWLVWWD